jgi:phenylacetic acid degradation operon negative regulatory protein
MAEQLAILSTVRRAPLSQFVYSSLSFFGRHRGGELPGMWFVRALRDLGRAAAAVRQTLYRMEAEGELATRREGRLKFYRATQYADAEIDAGLSKIFDAPAEAWDGLWTIVHVHLRTPAQRVARERVVALLAVEGFALVGGDVYVHPRDVGARLNEALSAAARPHVIVIRGRLTSAAVVPHLLKLWQLSRLEQRYRRTVAHLRELEQAIERGMSDRDAFVWRFAVVLDYLHVAWDDPELPRDVLPADWPAAEARQLAARLYRRLLKPATRHADALLQRSLERHLTHIT